MASMYKQEEETLRKMVRSHVLPAPEKVLSLNKYHKNKKVSGLFIKNNMHKKLWKNTVTSCTVIHAMLKSLILRKLTLDTRQLLLSKK